MNFPSLQWFSFDCNWSSLSDGNRVFVCVGVWFGCISYVFHYWKLFQEHPSRFNQSLTCGVARCESCLAFVSFVFFALLAFEFLVLILCSLVVMDGVGVSPEPFFSLLKTSFDFCPPNLEEDLELREKLTELEKHVVSTCRLCKVLDRRRQKKYATKHGNHSGSKPFESFFPHFDRKSGKKQIRAALREIAQKKAFSPGYAGLKIHVLDTEQQQPASEESGQHPSEEASDSMGDATVLEPLPPIKEPSFREAGFEEDEWEYSPPPGREPVVTAAPAADLSGLTERRTEGNEGEEEEEVQSDP